jgi:conjugative relaxase-like TrwC/TraI family protein
MFLPGRAVLPSPRGQSPAVQPDQPQRTRKAVLTMVMTLAKITAGTGYTYLTRHTARGDGAPPDMARREPAEAEIKKVKAEEAHRQRAAVAGFDLVFSPVKSAALLWAPDERPWVRDAIRTAHEEAKDAVLELLEAPAVLTRTGTDGVAQIATKGLIAAEFGHWDSRASDPDPHTHVAISSKVLGVDGTWHALDAPLYRMIVAASETYKTAFEAALTARLEVTFAARPDTRGGREPVREISNVPFGMIEFFSRRRAAIEDGYAELVRSYRDEHGPDPSAGAARQLAQQANLDTRPGAGLRGARHQADRRRPRGHAHPARLHPRTWSPARV